MPDERKQLPDGFTDWDRLKQVLYLGTEVLKTMGANSEAKAVSGSEVFKAAGQMFEAHDVPESTFIIYLSKLVKEKSAINTRGRKQGYYLSEIAERDAAKQEPDPDEAPEVAQNKQRERILYPFFMNWLFIQGYEQVKETADTRNKDLGTWSNPDVTGLRVYDLMGSINEIEIVTIEVKTSLDNWKYYIFEAVSHRRIANRSYFAFAHPEETLNKIDQDLRHYAELYNIGVLVLPLQSVDFDALKNGEPNLDGKADPNDIIELFSAPYAATSLQFRARYFQSLGIQSEKDLHKWGNRLE